MDAFCHNEDVLVELQDAKEFHCCQKDDQSQEQTLDVCPQTDEIKAHSRVGILVKFLHQPPVKTKQTKF